MRVRPFRFDDLDQVADLHRRVGWPMRSPEGWRWAAAAPGQADLGAPAGWVLADERDRARAFLGNLIRRFHRGDAVLYAATGHSIIVPPEVRGGSRALIDAFVSQAGLFAHFTLNANARSAPIYARHGLHPWPPETSGLKLSWIRDPLACAAARGFRWAAERSDLVARGIGERAMNARLDRPASVDWPSRVEVLTDVATCPDYAAFWTALKDEDRLLADRSPSALGWLLADPDAPRPPLVLGFRRDGRLTGYALAVLAKDSIVQVPTLEILDLQALEGEDDAVPALAGALIAAAPRLGAAKVRLQVVSARLLRRLGALGDQARREGGWGHCHAAFAEAPPQDWFPVPFDGDYPVCLRPAPRRA